jgi:hypothetical protein
LALANQLVEVLVGNKARVNSHPMEVLVLRIKAVGNQTLAVRGQIINLVFLLTNHHYRQ